MRRLAFILSIAMGSLAQAEGPPPGANVRDPKIVAMLAEISASRVQARIEKLVSFGTRHTLSDPTNETRGIGAARRYLKAEMDRIAEGSGGRMTVAFDSYIQPPARRVKVATEVVNVVATIKGSSPEAAKRFVVVSGHYDSICSRNEDATADAPGANDDASGTAVVLELAEALSKTDFDATIVLACVAGEEQGLLGSTHMADEFAKAGKGVEAMITNDIVGNTEGLGGRRDNRTLRVFSEGLPDPKTSPLATRLRAVGGENDSPSRQLARYVDEATALYLPRFRARPVFRADRYLRGGDHMPFLAKNFAAVRFTEPSENFDRQHQDVRDENGRAYGDVPSKVDFAYVADVARVNAATLASIALAPPAPANPTIETRRVENDTTLTWEAVKAPDLAGYEVLWRDTTAPTWEHALWVGDVTRASLPDLSKDDLHFGVRAVDREGHRSPVAFPLPPTRPAQ